MRTLVSRTSRLRGGRVGLLGVLLRRPRPQIVKEHGQSLTFLLDHARSLRYAASESAHVVLCVGESSRRNFIH